MNKNEFIEALREKLAGLPQEDIEKAAEYYGEMIDDRIDNGEAENEAVASVGSVDAAAENIIGEASLPKLIKERVRPKQPAKAWEIALLIIGSPVWVSLLIAALAVVFAVCVSAWAVVAAVYACVLGLAGGFVLGAVSAVMLMLHGSAAKGLFMLGAALVCGGLAVIVFFGANKLSKWMFVLSKKTVLAVKRLFVGKEQRK